MPEVLSSRLSSGRYTQQPPWTPLREREQPAEIVFYMSLWGFRSSLCCKTTTECTYIDTCVGRWVVCFFSVRSATRLAGSGGGRSFAFSTANDHSLSGTRGFPFPCFFLFPSLSFSPCLPLSISFCPSGTAFETEARGRCA